jgi:polyisoprenoid-binding protein YceI
MKYALAILTLLCTPAAATGARATSRAIDPAQSSAVFSVSHIWVERVKGTVPISSGSVVLAPDSAIPIAVTAVLDATRIATDEPDRDRSLESPGFFDAQKFPRWTFASTTITPKGSKAFEMDGNLTIHGVTQPERLNVTAGGTPAQPLYLATGEIDRHAFGMAVTRLDPTIGNSVEITLNVALK